MFRISGGPTHGKAQIFGVKKMSKNYRYARGGRIKSVKTYQKNSQIPVSVTKFDYNLFTDESKSSGYYYNDFYESVPQAQPSVRSDGEEIKNDHEMILYENVKVTDSIKNISVKYTYLTSNDVDSLYNLRNQDYNTVVFNQPFKKLGLIKNIEKYDTAGNLVEKTVNTNAIEYLTQTGITDLSGNPLKILFIKSSLANSQLRIENTTNMLHSSRENFFEPEHNLLERSLSTDFSGYSTEQKMYYPKDLNNQKLLNANLVSVPLRTELLEGGLLKGKAETKFDDLATVYPTSQIVYNMQTQQAQPSGSIEGYDDMGNVVEVKSKTGVSTVTIWGYYKTQPIAVIAGATYAQVKDLPVITAVVNASNSDDDNPSTEPALIQALDNLRKDNTLKNYQITTYTYDPLIGVTSTTLPSGMREINVYDNANRLLKVTDINGKTLKEFKYHYQNQP